MTIEKLEITQQAADYIKEKMIIGGSPVVIMELDLMINKLIALRNTYVFDLNTKAEKYFCRRR